MPPDDYDGGAYPPTTYYTRFFAKSKSISEEYRIFCGTGSKKLHITVLRLPGFAARRMLWFIPDGKRN